MEGPRGATATAATGRGDPADATPQPGKLTHRGDIDGLRALAIVLVVLYHAQVDAVSGGFVGVDVFFVISGWLICGQLFTATERGVGGALSFWARRLRRLVPAMSLMVLGVVALSILLLGPLDWHLIATRGAAASLFVSNLLFATSAGNYFDGTLTESPFLHTWSLGVELQAYLAWPLAFLVADRVGRSVPQAVRRVLVAGLLMVLASSFALCVVLTRADSIWAFYGLPTRAWEFAAGGLLFLVWPRGRSLSTVISLAASSIGLALLVGASVAFDAATAFPGVAAAIPVAGTVLLIAAGGGGGSPITRLLGSAPLQFVGRTSYSWYLWHWPLMIIAVQATRTDTVGVRLLAATAAFAVAVLGRWAVEEPIRRSPRLGRSLPMTYAAGALAVCLAVGSTVGLELLTRRQLQREPYRTYQEQANSYQSPDCVPAASDGVDYCISGATDGARTVVLLGDSHALQWTSAFGTAGERLGLRVVTRSVGNCSATPKVVPLPGERVCEVGWAASERLLEQLRPDAVVLVDAVSSRDDDAAAWALGVSEQVSALRAAGIGVGQVQDSLEYADPFRCLARGLSEGRCTPTRDAAAGELLDYLAETEVHRAVLGDVPQLDIVDTVCGPERCPLKDDGNWVSAGFNHLTDDFTISQVPEVEAFLRQVLEEG